MKDAPRWLLDFPHEEMIDVVMSHYGSNHKPEDVALAMLASGIIGAAAGGNKLEDIVSIVFDIYARLPNTDVKQEVDKLNTELKGMLNGRRNGSGSRFEQYDEDIRKPQDPGNYKEAGFVALEYSDDTKNSATFEVRHEVAKDAGAPVVIILHRGVEPEPRFVEDPDTYIIPLRRAEDLPVLQEEIVSSIRETGANPSSVDEARSVIRSVLRDFDRSGSYPNASQDAPAHD